MWCTPMTHDIKNNILPLCCMHCVPAATHSHIHKQRKKETEPSWFHLLTKMNWDYITRNGRNIRFCLEFGPYNKDSGGKRHKTDLDSVNELTREQCVTTHRLHFIRIDQIHKNVQCKRSQATRVFRQIYVLGRKKRFSKCLTGISHDDWTSTCWLQVLAVSGVIGKSNGDLFIRRELYSTVTPGTCWIGKSCLRGCHVKE